LLSAQFLSSTCATSPKDVATQLLSPKRDDMEYKASSVSSWATEGEEPGDTKLSTVNNDDRGVWTSDDELHATIRNRDCPPGPYLRGGLLGSGGWSCVYKVRRLRDGDLFAGKASKAIKQLRREATILRSFSHVSNTHNHAESDWPAKEIYI
jgi:hypothetical protein